MKNQPVQRMLILKRIKIATCLASYASWVDPQYKAPQMKCVTAKDSKNAKQIHQAFETKERNNEENHQVK